jgi:hypothetical protein
VIPRVKFELELEGTPRYRILADTKEAEQALIAWLSGPVPLVELAMAVHGLLDRLEDGLEEVS